MRRLCWQKTENKMVCLMNMALSIFAGFCLGMLLNYFWMPQIIICGAVAIVSTVTEHFLTVYALRKEAEKKAHADEAI